MNHNKKGGEIPMEPKFFRLKSHSIEFAINFANVTYISKTTASFEVYFIGHEQPIMFDTSSPTYALLQSWWEYQSKLPDYDEDIPIA